MNNVTMHIAKIFNKTTKNGKPYFTIQNEKNLYLNVWPDSFHPDWKEGMDIEVDKDFIETSGEGDQKFYWYKCPPWQKSAPIPTQSNERLERLETKIDKVLQLLEEMKRIGELKHKDISLAEEFSPIPDREEIDVTKIPF